MNTHSIKTCRIYTPPEKKTGKWILVDRLWPRNVKKESIDLDLWEKDIAPSDDLRHWFHKDPEQRWNDFIERYIKELHNNKDTLEKLQDIGKKHPLTLFYAAKDTKHNNAIILCEVLRAWPKSADVKSLH